VTATTSHINVKSVALPAEHGGWSFVLEPILLGLLLSPSAVGLLLAVAVFAAFLVRQPLKVMLVDWRRGRRYARTKLAERFVLLYGGIALAGLVVVAASAGYIVFFPLALALPLVLIQLAFDVTSRSRDWLPEVAGPTALASVASSIALAGGWSPEAALPLWAIVAARAVPTVLYVRARLRLEKGVAIISAPILVAHAAALIAVIGLAAAGLAPWLAAIALVILLLRAAYGLSSYRKPVPARIIGFQELAFGVTTVLLVSVGYALGL